MGGKGSKKEEVREEVWGENRLVEEDGWGGITSYNLLDLQVAAMDTGLLVTSTTVKILKLVKKKSQAILTQKSLLKYESTLKKVFLHAFFPIAMHCFVHENRYSSKNAVYHSSSNTTTKIRGNTCSPNGIFV